MKDANSILKLFFFISFSNAAWIDSSVLLSCQVVLLLVVYFVFADKRSYYKYVFWVLTVLLFIATLTVSLIALYERTSVEHKFIVPALRTYVMCCSCVLYFMIATTVEIYNLAVSLRLGKTFSIALYTALRLLPVLIEEVRMIVFSMNSKGADSIRGIKGLSKLPKKFGMMILPLINSTTGWLEQLDIIFYLRGASITTNRDSFKFNLTNFILLFLLITQVVIFFIYFAIPLLS